MSLKFKIYRNRTHNSTKSKWVFLSLQRVELKSAENCSIWWAAHAKDEIVSVDLC